MKICDALKYSREEEKGQFLLLSVYGAKLITVAALGQPWSICKPIGIAGEQPFMQKGFKAFGLYFQIMLHRVVCGPPWVYRFERNNLQESLVTT